MPGRGMAGQVARAEALQELGRPREALALLSQFLATEPEDVSALVAAARCHLALGAPYEALACVNRIVSVAPECATAHELASLVYTDLGDPGSAVSAALEGARLDPGSVVVQVTLANAYNADRQYKKALTSAAQAARIAPHESAAFIAEGNAHSGLGDRSAARDAYRRALRINPQSATAMNNLAAEDANQRRLGPAAHGLAAALAQDPQLDVARSNVDGILAAMMWRAYFFGIALAMVSLGAVAFGVSHAVRLSIAAAALVLLILAGRRLWHTLPERLRSYALHRAFRIDDLVLPALGAAVSVIMALGFLVVPNPVFESALAVARILILINIVAAVRLRSLKRGR